MKTQSKKFDVYQHVTDKIISQLENVNSNDWESPWLKLGGVPRNAMTQREYRGINAFMLGMDGFNSNQYATFKQWKEKDCTVNKGEKGTIVVFWKFSEYKTENDNGEEVTKESVMIRHYTVFNSEQVNGDYARECEKKEFDALQNRPDTHKASQDIIDNYLHAALVKTSYGGDRACYSSQLDRIKMPVIEQFKSDHGYYATFFHEIAHSTGHEKRLSRKLGNAFGSEDYAKEELIAEMASAMLCAHSGISQEPRQDHAMYIKSWLRALKNDKRFAVQAASAAQKATDFIIEKANESAVSKNLISNQKIAA